MKKRVKVVSDGAVQGQGDVPQSEDALDSSSSTQSPLKEQGVESEVTEGKQTCCVCLHLVSNSKTLSYYVGTYMSIMSI